MKQVLAAPNLPLHLANAVKTWFPVDKLPDNLPQLEALKAACGLKGITPVAYSYQVSTDSYLVYSERKA